MIFRLKEPARFYIHFMSRDRPIDDSGPILFQLISVRTCLFMLSCFAVGFFGHILVLSHVLVLSFFFSEILSQHHFLEMGALMSPLTLMAVIRTNWSNKASIIQQWQKKEYKWARGSGKLESVKFNFWRNCFFVVEQGHVLCCWIKFPLSCAVVISTCMWYNKM